MNAVAKYLITDFVVRNAAKGAVRIFEAVLAGSSPEKHESYVDFVTENADARLEAFVARNANLAENVAAKAENFKEESEEISRQLQEVLSPLLAFVKKGEKSE